jgi:hypothetical protein
MSERQPPRVTLDTPIGPDVDLDAEDIRLADGTRLTPEVAEEIVEHVRVTGRPSLTGPGKHSPEVSARVSPELRDAAKRQARQSGVSLSRLLRDALEWYLDYLARGGPGISGAGTRRGSRGTRD